MCWMKCCCVVIWWLWVLEMSALNDFVFLFAWYSIEHILIRCLLICRYSGNRKKYCSGVDDCGVDFFNSWRNGRSWFNNRWSLNVDDYGCFSSLPVIYNSLRIVYTLWVPESTKGDLLMTEVRGYRQYAKNYKLLVKWRNTRNHQHSNSIYY